VRVFRGSVTAAKFSQHSFSGREVLDQEDVMNILSVGWSVKTSCREADVCSRTRLTLDCLDRCSHGDLEEVRPSKCFDLYCSIVLAGTRYSHSIPVVNTIRYNTDKSVRLVKGKGGRRKKSE
jgi:hypothetical protein